MNTFMQIPLIKRVKEKFGYNFFIILGVIGIILISLSELKPNSNEKVNISDEENIREYRKELENELCQILETINGAGKVKVMITFESGTENVYVWQEKTTDDVQTASANGTDQESRRSSYENEIVIVTDGSEKQALIEKVVQPTINGVVVVCQGGDDIKVVSNITNAVSVALNVPTNRICVIKMQ